MEIIVTGLIAGVLGTLVMDLLNFLYARIGVISKIDMRIIGRMPGDGQNGASGIIIRKNWRVLQTRCFMAISRTIPSELGSRFHS